MSEKPATVDFGAPDGFGAHVFRVEIPAARTGEILIVEDYGYRGSEAGIPRDEERVVLERRVWSQISDVARREFNDRLKAAKLKTGRWHSGTNLVERLLGKELCVLAWAAEKASDDELPVIGSKWAALRPEERWWLFSMTVAEAGLARRHATRLAAGAFTWRCPTASAEAQQAPPAPAGTDLFSLPLFEEAE